MVTNYIFTARHGCAQHVETSIHMRYNELMSITALQSKTVHLIALVGLALFPLIPVPARPQTFVIEAESFADYHELGNVHISAVSDSGCSGRTKLVGLDFPEKMPCPA
jgi:hypothetical protein